MSNNVQYINPEGAPPAQGLYSHMTRVKSGDLIFVAGQLSVDNDGKIVGKHDFDLQFKQVFANLQAVLKAVGCDFNDVVRFNTFMAHAQDIEHFMRLRAEAFPRFFATDVYPPNTLLVVDRLVKEEFLVEVEAIVRARD
ncbi:endoribonuclease L-PSP [Caballeronia udeis]|uniref:Endoribonuclease L-PSP n=1 Tax=Caballeronia udeis TaxID=1232866 RepID=A0A158JPX6_9BURK|nr:RidA family protein [Caballeronia udeis]SAL70553.1 endoribonuclease L-PSP [Caballeronia udeis]